MESEIGRWTPCQWQGTFQNRFHKWFRNQYPKRFENLFAKRFPMNFQTANETVAQLIARFGPQRAGPYTKLRPHAEFIRELRRNCASYDTIVAILRERHA